jgi:Flp pilus assembly pilin Flp
MVKQFKALKSRQAGLTSVEYAVAGGLVVVAIIAALAVFGPALLSAFQNLFP